MKIIKLLLPLLVLTFTACSTAPNSASALKPNEKQMLGLWEEYSPGSNCVEFYDNHTMKIYLTAEEGRDVAGAHFIEANWTLDDNNVMTLTIDMGEQSFKQSAKIVFEKGEMWLKENNGTITKNRRVTEIPAKYKW